MKRLPRVLGWIAVAVAAVYLLLALKSNAHELGEISWSLRSSSFVAVGIVLYVASLVSGSLSWTILLRGLDSPIPVRSAVTIVLRSNLAKYLPGNVAQYVGRVALARRAGVPLPTALVSLTLEAVLTVAAGLVFVAMVSPRLLGRWLPAGVRSVSLLTVLLVATLIGAVLAAIRWYRSSRHVSSTSGPAVAPSVGPWVSLEGLALYTASFALLGLALTIVSRSLLEGPSGGFALFAGSFAVAWLAGFVVPGSPGGLGVREAVLVAELDPILGGGMALTLALLFRLTTLAGDAIAFAGGVALEAAGSRRRHEGPP